MEPQVTICCSRRNQKCCCLLRVLLGSFAGAFVITAITYFAAVATILGVLAIITVIYFFCNCRN